jgi:hypothetical protein
VAVARGRPLRPHSLCGSVAVRERGQAAPRGTTGLCCQGIELLCSRRIAPFAALHLALGNHVHELDAAQQEARAAKVLEAQHRSSQALDGPMVLLDDVVQF